MEGIRVLEVRKDFIAQILLDQTIETGQELAEADHLRDGENELQRVSMKSSSGAEIVDYYAITLKNFLSIKKLET